MHQLNYGIYSSPYGKCYLAFHQNDLYALLFGEDENEFLSEIKKRFTADEFVRNNTSAQKMGENIFLQGQLPELKLAGTDFQKDVWNALLRIPEGGTSTYAAIATQIGRPKAVRAVGTAIGQNPIAFLVPCHRVIRTDGKLGGYRWGLELKKQLLSKEGIK